MQKLDQTGQFAQLPDDLKTELILRVAADGKTDASEDRVKVLNRIKCLVTTCKSMRDCFMGNSVFNKRLSALLDHYPSKSEPAFLKKTEDALRDYFMNRFQLRGRKQLYPRLSNEEYQRRAALNENRIQKLVQAGVDLNRGMTSVGPRQTLDRILIQAVQELDRRLLRFLLEMGANINVKNDEGLTALANLVLSFACKCNSYVKPYSFANITQMIQILIDAGADIDMPDKDGKTALSHALEHYSPELAKFLVEKGARHSDLPLIKGTDMNHHAIRQTPLDYVWMEREKNLRYSCQLAEPWLELWTLMQGKK